MSPARFKNRPHLIKEGKRDASLFNIFLDLCQSHMADASVQMYTRILRNFQQFLKDHKLQLRQLRSEDVDVWLQQWQDHQPSQQVYAHILQRFLNFLGLLSPARGLQMDVPRPRNNNRKQLRRQLISEEDLKAFLQACGNDHRSALVGAILWETGLRVSVNYLIYIYILIKSLVSDYLKGMDMNGKKCNNNR